MSFVVTEPEAITAAAGNLAQIGSALGDASAAAAAPTIDVLPPAADEVSMAISQAFGFYGQEFSDFVAGLRGFQQNFEGLLKAGADAYANADAAALHALLVEMVPSGTAPFSAAAEAGATSLASSVNSSAQSLLSGTSVTLAAAEKSVQQIAGDVGQNVSGTVTALQTSSAATLLAGQIQAGRQAVASSLLGTRAALHGMRQAAGHALEQASANLMKAGSDAYATVEAGATSLLGSASTQLSGVIDDGAAAVADWADNFLDPSTPSGYIPNPPQELIDAFMEGIAARGGAAYSTLEASATSLLGSASTQLSGVIDDGAAAVADFADNFLDPSTPSGYIPNPPQELIDAFMEGIAARGGAAYSTLEASATSLLGSASTQLSGVIDDGAAVVADFADNFLDPSTPSGYIPNPPQELIDAFMEGIAARGGAAYSTLEASATSLLGSASTQLSGVIDDGAAAVADFADNFLDPSTPSGYIPALQF